MSSKNQKKSIGWLLFILLAFLSLAGFLIWHQSSEEVVEKGSKDGENLTTRKTNPEAIQPLRVHTPDVEFEGNEKLLSPGDLKAVLPPKLADVYVQNGSLSALMRSFVLRPDEQDNSSSKEKRGSLFVIEFPDSMSSYLSLLTAGDRLQAQTSEEREYLMVDNYSIKHCGKYHLMSNQGLSLLSIQEVLRKLSCTSSPLALFASEFAKGSLDVPGGSVAATNLKVEGVTLRILDVDLIESTQLQRREYRIGEELFFRWFFPDSLRVYYSRTYGEMELVISHYSRDLSLAQRYEIQRLLP